MSSPHPDFQIIPDTASIEEIDRDLRFHPSTVRDPRTLTRDQVETFNRDGFLTRLPLLSREETIDNRRYFDELLKQVMAAGGDSYSISTAHLKYKRVLELLVHPTLVGYARDLLGDNVIGWGSHYFCKMPHDGKVVTWHQDASYWPLTPSKTVTVWLAIDDADRENACMQFIPGSHLHGHLPFDVSNEEEQNVLNQTVRDLSRFPDPVSIELNSGEVSIHSDLLLHGSPANESDRRRCGLTLRYCAADVVAHMGWNVKGVLACGEADLRLWPQALELRRSL